ncbi:PD-(D/E)XK nuclease family protein (plasmid) [Deinococcus sp. KNUC1210]|uniref:PD-(D/E)XK nuclease family protein n=1 Tax=Deinococcus sp. KNUC1210 TaxID=2917691 RepID=UPI001EF0F5C9|nr:PD-(D/E)XK nuclease family protein [Deinococcus sp. KNUC1210]ULH14020.1 PD-(D/E)XK nuclease family protein [Deinococcus sp. KNUC1210]
MARTVIFSTLPLRTALQYLPGRQVVSPAPETVSTLGVTSISLAQLPGSAIPADADIDRALRRATRQLGLQGDRQLLRHTVLEVLLLSNADRAQMLAASRALAAFWQAFIEQLSTVPAGTPPVVTQPLLLVGFTSLSLGAMKLIDRVAADDSLLILPPPEISSLTPEEDAGRVLELLGWTVSLEDMEAQPDLGERLATRFFRGTPELGTGMEVRAAADRYYECLQALTSLQNVAGSALLVVPDLAQYAPTLGAAAWELGMELDLPLEQPLNATRAGAWLFELFKVLAGDWSYPQLQRVLSHPLARDVSPALRQAAARARPAHQAAWMAVGLPSWLRQWPERGDVQQFADLVFEVLNGLDTNLLTADDQRTGQYLLDDLDDLTANDELSLSDFADQCLQRLREPLLPEPRPGLPVRTPARVTGRFDHVAILGLSEGHLPAPPPNPPLLDFYDRRQLQQSGVSCCTALEYVRMRDQGFWSTLAAARQSLFLSYPLRIGKDLQLPSPYFARLGLTPPGEAAPWESPSDSGDNEREVRMLRSQQAAAARAEGHDHVFNGETGQSYDLTQHTFSATQFTHFSQCPYRWYAEDILGLKEPEDSGTELRPKERGSFYHSVLELVGRAVLGRPQTREDLLHHLPAAFDQAAQQLGLTRRVAWDRQRAEHYRRLQQTLEAPEFILEGFTITDVERAFDLTWRDLRLTGKIDRIDRDEHAHLLLTDYKSSARKPSGSRDPQSGVEHDIQLSLYLDVIAGLYPDLDVREGRYLSTTSASKRILGKVTLQPTALDGLRTRLNDAAVRGTFRPRPETPGQGCAGCALPLLCRLPANTSGDRT